VCIVLGGGASGESGEVEGLDWKSGVQEVVEGSPKSR